MTIAGEGVADTNGQKTGQGENKKFLHCTKSFHFGN
jgi:hypothetical protein